VLTAAVLVWIRRRTSADYNASEPGNQAVARSNSHPLVAGEHLTGVETA
jgi:hypothetical protein